MKNNPFRIKNEEGKDNSLLNTTQMGSMIKQDFFTDNDIDKIILFPEDNMIERKDN